MRSCSNARAASRQDLEHAGTQKHRLKTMRRGKVRIPSSAVEGIDWTSKTVRLRMKREELQRASPAVASPFYR
jgi:hypothetical protein